MAPPAPIKSSSPPMGAWEGESGKPIPCASRILENVINPIIISVCLVILFSLLDVGDFLGKGLVSGGEFHKVNTGW